MEAVTDAENVEEDKRTTQDDDLVCGAAFPEYYITYDIKP